MSSATYSSRGVGHGVGCTHVTSHPGCGSSKGAGWSGGEKVEKCRWRLENVLRPSWITVTTTRDPSYSGTVILS